MKYLHTKIVLFALIVLIGLELSAQTEEQIALEAHILNENREPIEKNYIQMINRINKDPLQISKKIYLSILFIINL